MGMSSGALGSSLTLPYTSGPPPQRFVDEVLDLVELAPLRSALVGLPGVSGLSVEQRKRLTIAVELVANPSVIFLDEPTSGAPPRPCPAELLQSSS